MHARFKCDGNPLLRYATHPQMVIQPKTKTLWGIKWGKSKNYKQQGPDIRGLECI
jgi:hypothetical protein